MFCQELEPTLNGFLCESNNCEILGHTSCDDRLQITTVNLVLHPPLQVFKHFLTSTYSGAGHFVACYSRLETPDVVILAAALSLPPSWADWNTEPHEKRGRQATLFAASFKCCFYRCSVTVIANANDQCDVTGFTGKHSSCHCLSSSREKLFISVTQLNGTRCIL